MRDFFISYKHADNNWAEWIAWQLEEAGYTTVLQSRDFRPGSNFVLEMQRSIQEVKRFIIVLSSAYLASLFTQPEWAEAFVRDPTGTNRTLIPVRVEPVEVTGLLSTIAYIDLVGKDDKEAKSALLSGILSERAMPLEHPSYPGKEQRNAPDKPLIYPGAALPAPSELVPFVERFQSDYPDSRRTAFIMMRFGSSPRHNNILLAVRQSLHRHNIQALRADDKSYAEYLMPNIRTYMHGCGFGVAVFERIESDMHNPNVALEVGYMMALGKPICLLKDRTLSRLPTDIIGALYREFDVDNPELTIQHSLDSWLRDREII